MAIDCDMSETIVLRSEFPVSAARVWQALTRPDDLAVWWGNHVQMGSGMGAEFVERWSDNGRPVVTSGMITRWEPPCRLCLTWADDDWHHETRVTFTISTVPGGATLDLVHEGWDVFPADRAHALRDAHEKGWRLHLGNLRDHVMQC